MTYQVFTKDGLPLAICSSLNEAMEKSKILGQFVKIRCADGTEIVGKFGADAITDGGLTPDGYIYEWKKEFSLGKRKKEWKQNEAKTDRQRT